METKKEATKDTTAVYIGAGESHVMLTPVNGGKWTHRGQEAILFVSAPNGTREFIVQALGKTVDADMKTSNSNVIVWEMPNDLKKLDGKTSKGTWKFKVTITDEMLEGWMDMVIQNVRPKGAIKPENEPVISNAYAKLQAKLAQMGNTVTVNDDDDEL